MSIQRPEQPARRSILLMVLFAVSAAAVWRATRDGAPRRNRDREPKLDQVPQPRPPAPQGPSSPNVDPSIRTLDLVFCLDSTGSMGAYISEAKHSLASILSVRLRTGPRPRHVTHA
jgi:hypothetical protein